jgi:hypothetical protein
MVEMLTIGGLARRMVDLFWPLVVEAAGFKHLDQPPTFLNLETAQFHMARIVDPLLQKGYFEGIAVNRSRIYSQILDNLNKAAFVPFPYTEIAARLQAAWLEPSENRQVYLDAQECATRFREYCLVNNLLDFSLIFEVFTRHVWANDFCREFLFGQYRHLIADNVEEDTPMAHDLLLQWVPETESALVIFDEQGGFRQFLGADPRSAERLLSACQAEIRMDKTLVEAPPIARLREHLAVSMGFPERMEKFDIREVLVFEQHRFYPEMLDWTTNQIVDLVEAGVPPGEIVVLAPFLSDALRFSLANRLKASGIEVQSHRPSRSLREEPAVQCLLTLAALAHPDWQISPPPFDIAFALRQSISGLDPIRAQLLSEILYRETEGALELQPFDRLNQAMRARVSYDIGERYEKLRQWLVRYREDPTAELDHFFSRIAGELLTQPGFHFHDDLDAGKAAANLIDSAREFRWVVGSQVEAEGGSVGASYLQMVQDGVIASQYIQNWDLQAEDAVLLAPAYTFLMNNRPVDYQFWLNVGSTGWWERLYQPLTHPHVLSRQWESGRVWTDMDEARANQETLYRLVSGLLRRCRSGVYLGLSDLDEYGFEEKGPLLQVIQTVLRRMRQMEGGDDSV